MLHFAPRYGIIANCLTWGLDRSLGQASSTGHARRKAANDNAPDGGPNAADKRSGANDDTAALDEALLEAALRLFAAHGLSAALRACEAAEICSAGGDPAGADWWLAVCAMLDSTMARACQARQHGRA